MKYGKQYVDGSPEFEISKEEAIRTIAAFYRNAKELAETPGEYNCKYSYVFVEED